MGAKVDENINGSIRAPIDRDSDLAEWTIAVDRKISQLEIVIDELCMQLLGAPAAGHFGSSVPDHGAQVADTGASFTASRER